tara:strand:- start:542 stop:760 length:219 start_codon:yes stop_codon:yes gene_type:complete
MKKIKKMKIKINGKLSTIDNDLSLLDYTARLKLPLKKVAIELNKEIVDKKKLGKIILKKDDEIEIVHFIGGG